MSLQPIELVSDPIENLPVVRAWLGLGRAQRAPDRIEVLEWKRKSIIFRLVGPGTRAVIAKGCGRATGLLERHFYASALPRVQLDPSGYRGFVDEADGTPCWLFFDDMGGEAYDTGRREHRELLTRWLASLHTRSARELAAGELPDRGPGHYREHLRSACRTMRANFDNPALSAADRAILDRSLAQLEAVEARWDDVEAACRDLPRALVHGDIAPRNLRVRTGAGGARLIVFDWEVAGWGVPGVDLAHADLELYGSLVAEAWPQVEGRTLRRMAHLGSLLRGGLAGCDWAVPNLATEWVEQPVTTLRIYQARIAEDLEALGWD